MSKNLFTIGMALLLSAGGLLADRAAGAQTKSLSGHVPAGVSGLAAKGLVAETNELNLAIGLPLRNADDLSNLLVQVYDPASTNYHKFLTPQEFTERFGPTVQDYQSVIDFAGKSGLTISGGYSNRMLVDVVGKVKDIQNAFHVKLHTYRHPTESRDFYAPDTEPSVDASLPIVHVSGLENYYLPHPNFHLQTAGLHSAATPGVGSAPGGAYQGKDFRNAYIPGSSLTGSGQNVALLQFDGFFASDIAAYENQIGLTTVPQLVVVPIDGGVPTPTPFGNPEVSLDIEMILSMSPGVSNIYVYEAPNPSPFEDILNRMVSDNTAKQISSSWGGGGPDPVAEQIFQEMALQGQSYFNASGDSDAYTGFIPFPSDSPHITVVGGTTLTTGPGAAYTSETVWNWGIEFGIDGVGSSGGVSPTYSIPTWQTNINMSARGGSQTMRNLPDVALTGDNVWVIFGGGQTGAFGGTSCASPLWAGFTALINQQAALNGFSSVGFLNPALYALAGKSTYTNNFHDITTGNNTWSGSPNLFFATNNYDLATGLGSPNGTNLINALVSSPPTTNAITHLSAPPPPYGSTLSALAGGNANGTWELFVQNDTPFNSGTITNGWWVTLTTGSPVGYAADNAITMTSSPGNVAVYGTVNYTITVTNYGPTGSTNVIVSDALPAGAVYFPASVNVTQGTVAHGTIDVVWSVGDLATNAGAKLTMTLEPTFGGSFDNFASVSADTADPNPDDDSASTTVTVGSVTPPQLTASLNKGSGTFQFTVSNGQSGQQYIVQASTNLVNWVNVFTNPAYSVPFSFTDTNVSSYGSRFYRVVP
jgi:uncharacterized repeat protein (TIGR01451 family)